jgi:CubicO group peptidase (beta-lactamase class C family)
VPNTPETKFRLGSITKQFTAAAVLVLQQQGKLRVDDRVKRHLLDAPKAWDEITIRHLLTHTSGIPNFTGFPEYLRTLSTRVTLKELIARFRDRPLDFAPGEKFRYSNSGYVVLGQVVENAAGQSYASFLKAAVFGPLEMKDSGYDVAETILKHRASGYTRRLGIILGNCDYVDMSIPHAAGALYSTPLDLLRWDQALYGDRLLSAASREAMFTPFRDDYAFGWGVDTKFGRKRQLHGGGINGFVTMIERFPEERLLVVVLCNDEGSPAGPVAHDLAAMALGRKYIIPREPKAVALAPEALDTCAGRYEVASPGREPAKEPNAVIITREGSRLLLQAGGKTRHALTPESDTLFYDRTADSELRFVKGLKDGKATQLILIRDGAEITATRKDEPAGKKGDK